MTEDSGIGDDHGPRCELSIGDDVGEADNVLRLMSLRSGAFERADDAKVITDGEVVLDIANRGDSAIYLPNNEKELCSYTFVFVDELMGEDNRDFGVGMSLASIHHCLLEPGEKAVATIDIFECGSVMPMTREKMRKMEERCYTAKLSYRGSVQDFEFELCLEKSDGVVNTGLENTDTQD